MRYRTVRRGGFSRCRFSADFVPLEVNSESPICKLFGIMQATWQYASYLDKRAGHMLFKSCVRYRKEEMSLESVSVRLSLGAMATCYSPSFFFSVRVLSIANCLQEAA